MQNLTSGNEAGKEDLDNFLRSYMTVPEPQLATRAPDDPQLNTIALTIADVIHATGRGSILDYGCGNGILLRKLSNLTQFSESNWTYVGIDYAERHEAILNEAFKLRLHRRTEVLLPENVSVVTASETTPSPFFVVVRNVLHELTIAATASFISWCASLLSPGQQLLIQDLEVFPEAERGNACWVPHHNCPAIGS